MSWREMRNFCEMMRTLGYPRLISYESFRTPNFALVSDILMWLAIRFDPNTDVPKCLDTEQHRVAFIRAIVSFMSTKAFIKLNAKRLYKADGYAVKEILKIVNFLYSALEFNKHMSGDNQPDLNLVEVLSVERLKQLQHTRYLASQLTSIGASLHSHMSHEVEFRQARNDAINRRLDIEWIEKCLTNACDAVREEIATTENALVNIKADENTLNGKIEKKRSELERNQKRLTTLQSVRPAYMEEYEQLEEELNVHYETYLTHFRNLSYLENLMEEFTSSEEAKIREDDAAIQSAVEELRKITDGADLFRDPSGGVGDNIFTAKGKPNLRKKMGMVEFSNANSERGFGVNGDSEGTGTYKSTSNDEDAEDGDDQGDSSTSSSDPITNDTEMEIVGGGYHEYDANENDDVIKGLSIVGRGYRMSGTWSPGRTRGNDSGDITTSAIGTNLFGKTQVTSSSDLKAGGGMNLPQEELDKALVEALEEAKALTEELAVADAERKTGNYKRQTIASHIPRIYEEAEDGEDDADDF